MIKIKYIHTKIFYTALIIGIAAGVMNAYMMDAYDFFFTADKFLNMLLFDVTLTEAFTRSVVLVLFIVFGYLLSKKQEELKVSNTLLKLSLDNSPECIYWLNEEGKIYYVNSSVAAKLGYGVDELRQRSIYDLHNHDKKYDEVLWKQQWQMLKKKGTMTFETSFITKLGDILNVEIVSNMIEHDNKHYFVGFVRDITRRLQREKTIQKLLIHAGSTNKKLKVLANKDRLTGIFNRLKFDDFLNQYIMEYRRYKKSFALIMCDIDHFKNINDKYGHKAGDEVLKEFVLLLQEYTRESDLLARWGGEEFMLLLPQTHLEQAKKVAEKIRASTEQRIHAQSDNITVSIGVVEVENKDTSESIFLHVDKALYRAKNSGRNRVCTAAA